MGQRRLRSVLRAAVSSDSTGLALVLSSSTHCVREGDEQPQICCEVDAEFLIELGVDDGVEGTATDWTTP